MLSPSKKNIDYGVQKFTDFVKVQSSNDRSSRMEAIDYLALAVGIDSSKWEYLTSKLDGLVESPGGELGWAIIGVIIGLYIAENAVETDEVSSGPASI